MKILVTGGAGFIGSHVVDLYLKHGHDVVIVDDLSTGRIENLNPEAVFYELDIRSPEIQEIFQRERPQVVNHHAAQMDVRRSIVEPIFDADVNIGGSINLLECSRRYGTERFVYISSGGAAYGEPEYLPCDEDHPVNPICQYGASKHTVEHYLFMYRQNYGLEYTVLRYPNVYGPRQDPNGEAGVVAIFLGQMLSGEQVVINGDGEQQRDFVFVSDCAQANLFALTASKGSGIYNLGAGEGTSINEVFTRLQKAVGYQEIEIHGTPKLGETRKIYLDAGKAYRELGWSPTTSLEEGLKRTVAWFRTNEKSAAQTPLVTVSTELALEQSKGLMDRSGSIPEKLDANGDRVESDGSNGSSRTSRGLTILRIMDLELREQNELGSVLKALLECALEVVGADSGSVIALDAHSDVLSHVLSHSGRDQSKNQKSEPLDDLLSAGLAGWVVEQGRAAFVENTQEDPRWMMRAWDRNSLTPRSAISVPLIVSDKVAGVLTLVRSGAAKFHEQDLALLMTISGIVSYEEANLPFPGNGSETSGAGRARLPEPGRFTH